MVFLLNQSIDFVVKPMGILVIRDYIFIWNELIGGIKYVNATIHDETTLIYKRSCQCSRTSLTKYV